jgi:hypothetical protein
MKSASQVLVLACVALLPVTMAAQKKQKKQTPKTPQGLAEVNNVSRWDVFVGYSYLAPKDSLYVLQPDGVTQSQFTYKSANYGVTGSASYFFTKYLGAQVDVGSHAMWTDDHTSNDEFLTTSAGLIARFSTQEVTPFVHALVGAARVGGPDFEPLKWGPALTIGGGMDYALPVLHGRLALRLFQVDYEYMHENWGPGIYGGRANINAARLSSGLVAHFGDQTPPPAVTLTSVASPTEVFAGDPVTVTATPTNIGPKVHALYGWSGDGVTGKETVGHVDTLKLAPGTYTVKTTLKVGKLGKEGLKPGQSAEAAATFTVKQFEPPTVSCSASPNSIKPGDTVTVSATGVSPQNRPLTYAYAASVGAVSGTAATATYNSTGAPTGAVEITCTTTDDKGQAANGTTTITIVAPYVPPAPKTQALCSFTFSKDKKRPARVDNEAKACLDDVALTAQKQSGAKLVVVGSATSDEKAAADKATKLEAKKKHPKPVDDLAAQRAVDTKEYLVKEKGIDASLISVATSASDSQKVEDYLVPAGATFTSDVQGTTPVNEGSVKAEERKPLPVKQAVHKKAAK